MPGGDGTGPRGRERRTGRGRGYCRGYDEPGYDNQQPGRGRGFGVGQGRGRGRSSGYPQPAADEEAALLRAESSRLKQQLEEIEKRLAGYEKKD